MDQRDHIAEDMRAMKSKINLIYTALLGDEITKNGGLVKRIGDTESNVRNMGDRMDKIERKIIPIAIHTRLLYVAAGVIIMAILSLIIK